VDVGCGWGRELQELRLQGCQAAGVDIDLERARACRALGFPVVLAKGEQMPFRDGLADGVICRGALPYMNERLAIAECARLLKPGGKMEAYYHGLGYYVGHLLFGDSMETRRWAARAILNSWFYVVTAGRSHRRFSTDVYQSHRRLARLYEANGLILEHAAPVPTFFGLPVFIYHRLRKARCTN